MVMLSRHNGILFPFFFPLYDGTLRSINCEINLNDYSMLCGDCCHELLLLGFRSGYILCFLCHSCVSFKLIWGILISPLLYWACQHVNCLVVCYLCMLVYLYHADSEFFPIQTLKHTNDLLMAVHDFATVFSYAINLTISSCGLWFRFCSWLTISNLYWML